MDAQIYITFSVCCKSVDIYKILYVIFLYAFGNIIFIWAVLIKICIIEIILSFNNRFPIYSLDYWNYTRRTRIINYLSSFRSRISILLLYFFRLGFLIFGSRYFLIASPGLVFSSSLASASYILMIAPS